MENKIIKNNKLLTITRKSEKLTTAVYLITDFFDSRESLRWELRARALSFLSFTDALFHKGKDEREITKDTPRALIEEILLFLGLARNVSLVSSMNFSILKEEYQILLSIILAEMRQRMDLNDFEFPERFFAASQESRPRMESDAKDKPLHIEESIKDTDIGHARLSQDYITAYGENVARYKKDIRRETIVKMLRAKGEITVKDISYLMSGVSEKTIQRELIAMVDEGILAKEGERRWSKYLLKT